MIEKKTGRIKKACICRWNESGTKLEFDHMEDWDNLIYDGYFTDIDQDRGVSPMAAAVNRMKDTMEALEWTNLKIKLHALFGVAFARDGTTGLWPSPNAEDERSATDTGQPTKSVSPQKGIMVFDLNPGETVDAIESKTPASEFVDYEQLSIRLALLSMDIPYTFFDSSKSSYSARIADANMYEFLARVKREKNRNVLQEYSDWKLRTWLLSDAPMFKPLQEAFNASNLTLRDLQRSVTWEGRQTPWIDKLKQLEGDEKEIAMGINSRRRIMKARGVTATPEMIMQELGEEEGWAEEYGATLAVGMPGQVTTEKEKASADDK